MARWPFKATSLQNTATRRLRAAATPEPALIRANVRAVIDVLRSAAGMQWDERGLRYHKAVMPQTTNWLPADERLELLQEFDAEVARLTAAP